MKKFGIVGIIGVGMIGGSIGMALRKRRLADKVIGLGRNPIKLRRAKVLGAIEEGYTDFDKGLKNAGLVIVATPVGLIPVMIKRAFPYLEDGSIITDVGSVKCQLIRKIERFLPQRIHFVGAHPIAGLETFGVENAKPTLFQESNCVLTPTPSTDANALRVIGEMWKGIGARVLLINPVQHDELLAFTSHLPHLIAVSLIEVLCNLNKKYKNTKEFIGGGFRDTTRIACGSPIMWRDICLANKKEILNALRKFKSTTNQIEEIISNEKWDMLLRKLIRAKKERDSLK